MSKNLCPSLLRLLSLSLILCFPSSPTNHVIPRSICRARRLLEQKYRSCEDIVQSRRSRRICNHGQDDSLTTKHCRNHWRVRLCIEGYGDVVDAVEEDGVVILSSHEVRYTSFVVVTVGLVHECDRRSWVAGWNGRVVAELGYFLCWIGVWRVLGGDSFLRRWSSLMLRRGSSSHRGTRCLQDPQKDRGPRSRW